MDISNRSVGEFPDERCLNITPINCGEKFESFILPRRQYRKVFKSNHFRSYLQNVQENREY